MNLITSETAPPSTPQEQQHVLLRRLIKRVTIGVTDEFGSALLPNEDAGRHWPDATTIDDFDEVGDDFSDEALRRARRRGLATTLVGTQKSN